MPLFSGSTEQFRGFVPVTINYTVDDVMPQLLDLESGMLVKFLGDELAGQIVGLAEATLSQPGDRVKLRALYLARAFVAKIGMLRHLPFAQVQLGDDGLTISGGTERRVAFQYQANGVAQALSDQGFRALDELIILVDKNADLFPSWSSSPYYQEHQDALFKSAASFSKYYPIQDRWLSFWTLRPFIQAVEEAQGPSAQARIDALPDEVTDEQKEKVFRSALRAMAYQAVLNALPALSVILNGVNLQINYASQFENIDCFTAPSKEQLDWVMLNLQKQIDLAWSVFSDSLLALTPDASTPTDATGTNLIYSSGPITFL